MGILKLEVHTLTLLGGLYHMFLEGTAVYIMLCCCVQKDFVLELQRTIEIFRGEVSLPARFVLFVHIVIT